MSYEIDDLIKLAARLSVAADVSEAKAKAHSEAGEADLAERETQRTESGRHYVEVLHHFAKLLKAKERNKGPANKPTLEEALAYAAEHESCKGWPAEDVKAWYDHFSSNGWKVSGKTPMKCWQSALRNGARFYFKNNGKPSPGTPSKALEGALAKEEDPLGWKSFLHTVLDRPYVAYAYAPNCIKQAYKKSL